MTRKRRHRHFRGRGFEHIQRTEDNRHLPAHIVRMNEWGIESTAKYLTQREKFYESARNEKVPETLAATVLEFSQLAQVEITPPTPNQVA